MTKISSKLRIYLYSALAITALAIIICTLSYLLSFDSDVGYFSFSGTPLPSIFVSLCVIGFIWFASALFLLPKDTLDGASPTTVTVSIAATPLCICSLLLGLLNVIAYLSIPGRNIFAELFPSYTAANSNLLLICGIILIISAIYFGLLWTKGSSASTLLGFFIPVACLLLIAITYFDLFVAMNSPIKFCFQLSALSFMLFMLYELRVSLEKPKPRAYLFTAMTAVLFSGIASVPQIVAYFAGCFNDTAYLLYAIFSLCIFIYTLSRLIVFVSARSLLEKLSDQTYTEEEETGEAEKE